VTDRSMTSGKGVLLSLPVVTVALGALAVGLIALGRYWGLGLSSLYFLVVPVALALLYARWYRTLPYEPRGVPAGARPVSLPGVADDEPFEDPVEEADRLSQARAAGPSSKEPTVVENDPSADSPSDP